MKFNKFFTTLCAIAVFGIMAETHVAAQNNGLYSPANIFAGGNVSLPAASTNLFWTYALTNGVQNGVITTNNSFGNLADSSSSNLTLNVSEYDYAGLTYVVTSDASSTNAPVGVAVFTSNDYGKTFAAAPSFSWTNSIAAPGGTSQKYTTNSWDIHGVSTLGFKFYNLATAGQATNYLSVNLKSARISVQPAGINNGVTPGKPITVPNFP